MILFLVIVIHPSLFTFSFLWHFAYSYLVVIFSASFDNLQPIWKVFLANNVYLLFYLLHQAKLEIGCTNLNCLNELSIFAYYLINFCYRNHFFILMEGEATGRLLRYDPPTRTTHVVLDGLAFPNGVQLSKDQSFLLFTETTNCR